MPNQIHSVLVHTMSGYELSRVRTERYRTVHNPIRSPHPVQPNGQPASHGYLGNASFPTHRQVHVPTSPVWVGTNGSLRCFHQQETQQSAALLADVSQSLPACTGILGRNQPHVAADLLATFESFRSPDDQHEGQRREKPHTRMGHQPQYFGPLLRFLFNSGS